MYIAYDLPIVARWPHAATPLQRTIVQWSGLSPFHLGLHQILKKKSSLFIHLGQ